MLDQLACVYVFKREAPLRVKVTKLSNGKPAASYYLLGDDACSCPGFQKTSRCKHRLMWESLYTEDSVKVHEIEGIVQSIAQSLGCPPIPPTVEGVDPSFVEVRLTTIIVPKEKFSYDLAVCIVPVGTKNVLVEIRRLNNATGSGLSS
jgi:hypothetical protein